MRSHLACQPAIQSYMVILVLSHSWDTQGYSPPPIIQVYPPGSTRCSHGTSGQCHHHNQLGPGSGQSWSPSPHNEAPQPLQTQHLSTSSSSGGNHHSSHIPLASIPEIITWFTYLDWDEEWGHDGINFAPLSHILKGKGFVHLSQLSDRYIKISNLKEWLGIDTGTAITIFQYANEDLEAIRSGEWFFPHEF